VVAEGRVAERERGRFAGRPEAQRLGAVDRLAVQAAAAEVDGLVVPGLGQVDREADRRRLRIDRQDAAAHAAMGTEAVAGGLRPGGGLAYVPRTPTRG